VNGVPLICGVVGFHVQAVHFIERHGLAIILALGESIVASARPQRALLLRG
jgi:low temperature requirement protein LtrA